MDDRHRRGRRPLAETDIIDEAAEGSQPDVEVFRMEDLAGGDPGQATAARRKGGWIEEVRTTVWEGRDPPPDPSMRRPSRGDSVRLRASVRRSRQSQAVRRSSRPLDPGRQIEAPARIKVKTVARISPDPRLWLMTRPDSIPAEQFRVLALRLREELGARVVAVTSPTREGEGQLAAANLALAFAESGRTKTVLLDADLRGAEIAELYDLADGPGLGEQIRSHRRHPEQNWITLGLSSRLHLLPSGAQEKNPAALLSSELMEDLMGELRRYFDFIVIGSPPALESADVNILQEHVDGVLLVVRAGVTRRDAVSTSIDRLGQSRFLGAVLVDSRIRTNR